MYTGTAHIKVAAAGPRAARPVHEAPEPTGAHLSLSPDEGRSMAENSSTEDLCYLPASKALSLFRRRELSPVELMQATIARIEAVDGLINALPVRFFEEALEGARAAEARFAGHGNPRPLEGLPVAVKDEVEVAGQPCTEGSLIYKDNVAEHTAAYVQRIIDAGGIIHARAATPEFCCAVITASRLWGVTRNPWNLDYSPGGSSGGSAAALAAGMASLATGSDIGGSIRIPASFCGVVGFKPPYGRVPQDPPFNLDHYCHDGPLARTVEDCRLLENVMAGPHPDDIVSLRPKLTIPARLPGIEGWRIAVSPDLGGFAVAREVRVAMTSTAGVFRELGAHVEEAELKLPVAAVREAARAHFATIFGSYVGQSLAEHRDLMTSYAIAFAEDAARPVVSYFRSLEIESEVWAEVAAVLQNHRVLLAPAFGLAALAATADDYDPDAIYDYGTTLVFNMCSRCPVLVVPCGRSREGVPLGVQIVGRTYDDVSVFRAAAAFAAAQPWYDKPERRPTV
jgi:Asp-tRNA(Asn)/Glu-tRNA(Gln) amidotransferase A subunit family amidase